MCSTLTEMYEALARLGASAAPPQDAAELIALRQLVDRALQAYLARLGAFDAAGGADADGSGSTAAWLRRHAGALPAEARGEVWLARRLHTDVDRPLDVTAELLAGGEMSVGQARAIAGSMQRLPVQVVADLEPTVARAVADLDPAATDRICRHVVEIAADEQPVARAERERAARHLDLRFVGGTLHLDGLLAPLEAEPLRVAIEALSRPADGPERDPRTAPMRRADALTELARVALRAGELPNTGGTRPQVHVVVALAALASGVGSAHTDHGEAVGAVGARQTACDSEVTWTALNRRVRASPGSDGWAAAATQAAPGANAGAVLSRLLDALPPALGGSSPEILVAGRTVRIVPTPLRRRLNLRDKGCIHPGCDRPPERCEAHHIRHWVDGGRTDLENLVLACSYHHHLWHTRALTPVRVPSGGWTLGPAPPPLRKTA